jgi:hypothetical protein
LAAVITATAWIAIPVILLTLRKQLESLESAQSETAAFIASEYKRLANMIAQQRSKQIGDALRRSTNDRQRQTILRQPPEEASPVQLPLRKTIH